MMVLKELSRLPRDQCVLPVLALRNVMHVVAMDNGNHVRYVSHMRVMFHSSQTCNLGWPARPRNCPRICSLACPYNGGQHALTQPVNMSTQNTKTQTTNISSHKH